MTAAPPDGILGPGDLDTGVEAPDEGDLVRKAFFNLYLSWLLVFGGATVRTS